MPDPPVVDPRLNCAAGICCDNAMGMSTVAVATIANTMSLSESAQPACASHRAQAAILVDAGVSEDEAPRVAARLRSMGVAFTSIEINDAIRRVVVVSAADYSDS